MKENSKKIVGLGLLTAIVIVLQALAISIRFGVFNITLVLVPIIVGAALYGYKAGAWLGGVFGVVVLFPLVVKITKNYVNRRIKGKDEKPVLSYDEGIQAEAEVALDEE